MKLKELLTENRIIKFYYKNYKHDKYPNVYEFDKDYKGNDILGWNLNYYKNKDEAIESLNDIIDFASLISDNKLDIYKRVKKLFPEQSKLIRRYKKNAIKHLRFKDKDGLWHKGEI